GVVGAVEQLVDPQTAFIGAVVVEEVLQGGDGGDSAVEGEAEPAKELGGAGERGRLDGGLFPPGGDVRVDASRQGGGSERGRGGGRGRATAETAERGAAWLVGSVSR